MNEKIKLLLEQYDDELAQLKILPCRSEDYCGDIGVQGLQDNMKQMAHIRWMISQMVDDTGPKQWSDRKINRWFGFIQGVFWCNKMRGISEMRGESRGLYLEGLE